MENNEYRGSIQALRAARDKAFEQANNLDLSNEQRDQYFEKAEELKALISQLAEQEIHKTSAELLEHSEVKSCTQEIVDVTKQLDWNHTQSQSANNNLGNITKLVDTGKKILDLFTRS